MRTGLPNGLQALLGKLGITLQKAGEAKVAEHALKGGDAKEAKAPEKGKELGDGTLLTGIGFNSEDRRTAMKNVAEKQNIDRFMQDPGADAGELKQALKQAKDGDAPDKGEAGARRMDEKGAEVRERREDVRREEKADDVRVQAQEVKEQREKRETAEAKEHERERERERERQDDDEKHGAAWVQEELEREEEEKQRRGMRDGDAIGEATRCRGELEDGTRCLRRPMSGTPYCREHAVPGR